MWVFAAWPGSWNFLEVTKWQQENSQEESDIQEAGHSSVMDEWQERACEETTRAIQAADSKPRYHIRDGSTVNVAQSTRFRNQFGVEKGICELGCSNNFDGF